MSPREKKLLIFFAAAGFIVINFVLVGFFQKQRNQVNQQLAQARQKLDTAERFRESRDQVEDEMNWLAEHEPEPAEEQDVQSKLQELCDREAKNAGLTIKSQKPIQTDATEGRNYHRAKFQFNVTGADADLYRWLYAINVPDQFRIATSIRISPVKDDDTKVECVATIEQWFVPAVATE